MTLAHATLPARTQGLPRIRHTSAERRNEVVQTIVEIAGELGPDAVTTQEIASRMGVTHGALFRHFEDKAAMWTAVFEWVREQLGAVIDMAFATGGNPLAVLENVFMRHVSFVARNPGVPRILYYELQFCGVSPQRREACRMVSGYRRRLATLMCEAKLQGELPFGMDEEAAAMLFIGAVQGLVVQSSLFNDEAGMIDAARRIFPLFLDGIRGKPSVDLSEQGIVEQGAS
jgi:AcrR family transcriptional regulator